MAKTIKESLYRWQKEGWHVEKNVDDQYTLTHPRARTIICGSRTQFQTVGMVQGEMQRALQDGPPKPVPAAPLAEPQPTRTKPKKKARRTQQPGEVFSFDAPPRPFPSSPYRRKPAVAVEAAPTVRRTLPFENAAWELAYLTLKANRFEDHVIGIMEHRYQTDEQYRSQLIRNFQETPQAKIQALRERVKRESASD
jgi:hypothetical protein